MALHASNSGAPARHRSSVRTATLLVSVAVMTALATGWWLAPELASHGAADSDHSSTAGFPRGSGSPAGPPAHPDPDVFDGHWVAVLDRFDAVREAAWRQGDPALLRRIYSPGSAVLRDDQRMLRAYLHRGLTVRGVSLGYFVEQAVSLPDGRVSLVVVDRLGASYAIEGSGPEAALPVDRPTRHRIILRRFDGSWRIERISYADSVEAVDSAARSWLARSG